MGSMAATTSERAARRPPRKPGLAACLAAAVCGFQPASSAQDLKPGKPEELELVQWIDERPSYRLHGEAAAEWAQEIQFAARVEEYMLSSNASRILAYGYSRGLRAPNADMGFVFVEVVNNRGQRVAQYLSPRASRRFSHSLPYPSVEELIALDGQCLVRFAKERPQDGEKWLSVDLDGAGVLTPFTLRPPHSEHIRFRVARILPLHGSGFLAVLWKNEGTSATDTVSVLDPRGELHWEASFAPVDSREELESPVADMEYLPGAEAALAFRLMNGESVRVDLHPSPHRAK